MKDQKVDPKLIQDLFTKYWVNMKGLQSSDMIRTSNAGLFVDFMMETFCTAKGNPFPKMVRDKLNELSGCLPSNMDPYLAMAFTTGFSLGIFLSEAGLASFITAERARKK